MASPKEVLSALVGAVYFLTVASFKIRMVSLQTSDRIQNLDGLRAIAILLVLATHMLPLGPKVLRLNETAGAMGMSLFFALSGFLIVSLLMRNSDVTEFLIRRLTRILPLAVAYAVIVFLVIQFDPTSLFATLSFIENYTEQLNGYNGHFWSLCVEVHFYLAMALAVLVCGRRAVYLVWPACFLITALRIDQGVLMAIKTHLRVDEILAGACVATLFHNGWLKKMSVGYVGLGIVCLLWFVSSSPYAGWPQYARPYFSAMLLTAVLVYEGRYLSAILSSAPMRYVATVSYALYVIHPATIQGWMNEGSTFERYLIKRPISFLATFALAHLSTFHWEKAWITGGRSLIERRRTPQMAF